MMCIMRGITEEHSKAKEISGKRSPKNPPYAKLHKAAQMKESKQEYRGEYMHVNGRFVRLSTKRHMRVPCVSEIENKYVYYAVVWYNVTTGVGQRSKYVSGQKKEGTAKRETVQST